MSWQLRAAVALVVIGTPTATLHVPDWALCRTARGAKKSKAWNQHVAVQFCMFLGLAVKERRLLLLKLKLNKGFKRFTDLACSPMS